MLIHHSNDVVHELDAVAHPSARFYGRHTLGRYGASDANEGISFGHRKHSFPGQLGFADGAQLLFNAGIARLCRSPLAMPLFDICARFPAKGVARMLLRRSNERPVMAMAAPKTKSRPNFPPDLPRRRLRQPRPCPHAHEDRGFVDCRAEENAGRKRQGTRPESACGTEICIEDAAVIGQPIYCPTCNEQIQIRSRNQIS